MIEMKDYLVLLFQKLMDHAAPIIYIFALT